LLAVDELLAPGVAESSSHAVTGFLFFDEQQPPEEELQKLEKRSRPVVYVGSFRITDWDQQRLIPYLCKALTSAGYEGLFSSDWNGLQQSDLPSGFGVVRSEIDSWILPRVQAIVHSGGTETTAKALRAGIPQLIVPYSVDELDWGNRIQNIGAGPEPVDDFSEKRFDDAFSKFVAGSSFAQKAASVAEKIRANDGPTKASEFLERFAS